MALTHSKSGDVVTVLPLGDDLRNTSTFAITKSRNLEVVRLVLPRGRALPTHHVTGEATILGVEGACEVTLAAGTVTLSAGELLFLGPGEPHGLLALDDFSALVTIALVPAAAN